ncbi:hypothetical protein [Flindersiella endophytica]
MGALSVVHELPSIGSVLPSLQDGLTFSTELDIVVGGTRQLWAGDLQGSVMPDLIPAAELLRPVTRWLVTPPGTSPQRQGTLRVGTGDVEAVHATVRLFEKLDHDYGGGYARKAAVQYLHSSIIPLLEGSYTAATGRRLFAVATEATYKTGAMAYDIGQHGLARQYFVQALSLAHASDDRALGGKVLALMSHQANFLGEYGDAVDFARAAKLGGYRQATPRIRAMYCAMEARALASLGDRPGCYRALQEMDRAFGETDAEHHDPDWINYFNVAEFHNELAHCFAALGEPQEASRYAALALAESGDQYPRSQTFCRLAVAAAQLSPRRPGDRDVDQACALAEGGLSSVARLKSSRVRAYLDTFNTKLDRYADSTAAGNFRERQVATFAADES